MRWVKVAVGLVLLPGCVAVSLLFGELLFHGLADGTHSASWVSVMSLVAGVAAWVFLYFVMPPPVRSYVLAHELTHVLWGWIMGAHVRKLRVSSKGGSVALSKTNILIELAPYFFPFYTILIVLVYLGTCLFLDQDRYKPLWLGVIGLTWGFHLTFTISALSKHQPDIEQNGRMLSYALIYALNVLEMSICVVVVTAVTWDQFLVRLSQYSVRTYAAVGKFTWYLIGAAIRWIRSAAAHRG